MIEITLVKRDGVLVPATEYDKELMSVFKQGEGVKVKAVKVRQRSLAHHRLFFGGLLQLTMDYWEPDSDMIASGEKKTLEVFAKWLDDKSGNTGAIFKARDVFLLELGESRSLRIAPLERTKKGLLDWIKDKVGHVTLQITPDGIRKDPKSINFNSMGQDEFNDLYNKAFTVCWNLILKRTFDTEEDAQKAVDELINLGN